MNEGRVQDKVAIITGAGSGIGRAIAVLLAAEGANVIATDINQAAAQLTARQSVDSGGRATALLLDVTDEESWQAALDTVVTDFGQLDVLVNNAGIAPPKSIAECSLAEFRQVNDINLHGTFIGCKAAIAVMRKLSADDKPVIGSIINMSSMAGQLAISQFAAYCTSKAAVTNMCNALAVELGESGDQIRMNSVHPGPVKTEMTLSYYGDDYYNDLSNFSFLPLKKYAEVKDVAYAVLYLASNESRLVTGSQMNVDSGAMAGLLVDFS